ncbi:MAG: T9SS type A sorting domain-containing protein [Saprospiraceae bacterium]|nr:T9SS type A sorting domain-containing protein [Saprospiraceae bacterium]
MTQLFTLILWFLTQLNWPTQPCLPEGIVFTTQGQVDSFNIYYPGCNQIQGNVDITGPEIKNLDSLYSILSIDGNLQVLFADSLLNLKGLKKLQTIGGTLLLYETAQISSFVGLDSLKTIGGNLDIQYNDQLVSLEGLNNLQLLDGNLTLGNNPVLNDIQAPDHVEFSFQTFITITDCSRLSVCSNSSICNFLVNETQFLIEKNDTGCNSFLQLLQSCDPASACPAGGIVLRSQADIVEFATLFPSCSELKGSLTIHSFAIPIYDLSPLIQITSVAKELYIFNTDLQSLHGLDSLQSIGTDLDIQENHGLKSLAGLSSLNKVNGFLSVADNDSLESLEGLGPIDPDSLNYLYLTNSKSLSICNLESICTYLSNGGLRDISNNALGCSSPFQVNKACFPDEVCPAGNLRFYTQLDLDQFAAAYPNCQDLSGFLQIGPSTGESPITSLAGLSGIRSIAGYLDITQNPSLKSLSGLDSLRQVDGYVSINTNDSLVNLTGLNSLNSISDQLFIRFNDQLTSLTGLGQIQFVSLLALFIENNPLLSFCNVAAVCNFLIASDDVIIRFNAPGCANLAQASAACGIYSCVESGIVFSSQEQVDHFPTDYPGCNRILGDVTIAGPDIENLDSLIQLQYINGTFSIFSNTILTSMDGLSNLKSVLYLDIENNPLLPDLSGLSSLALTGGILIYNNLAITSLDGLGQLDYNAINDIYVEANPNLSVCDVRSICSYLDDPLKTNSAYFAFNNVGCNSPSQVKTSCGTALCPSGALILTTQSEIDLFPATYKDCTILPGDLIIDGADITHLDSLKGITTLYGQLILQNTRLKSLNGIGFISPATITHLSIQNNDSLAVCEMRLICDYLSDTTNTYTFTGNAPTCASSSAILTECARTCFWEGLTLSSQAEVDSFTFNYGTCSYIPGELIISGDDITHLDSLYNLITLGGGLFINQTSVSDLNGLENLKTLGSSLSIRNCPMLNDISQLGGIDSLGGSLSIENTQLLNLNGLQGIRYVPFTIAVLNNPALVSLAGLSSIERTGLALSIQSNAVLPSLSGLETLKTIGTNINIHNNSQLRTLAGLSGIESIFTVCSIENNPNLDSLVGLISLKSIGSELFIRNNAVLKNVHSLKALSSVRRLTFANNPVLTSLKGLETIDPVMLTNLVIQNSGNLAICNMGSLCTYLSITPAKSFTISGNATTCSSKDQILASCASFFPVSLIFFRATAGLGKSILQWQTASEQDLAFYTIEHSTDGVHFQTIGTQSVVGNSIQLKTYQLVHYSPPSGHNYYRLKMIDQDGGFNYSDVVSLRGLEKIKVYPNPTQNKVYIRGLEGQSVRVIVKDMIGRLLFETFISEGQAIDLSKHQSGVYLLSVESGDQAPVFRVIRE